MMQTHIDRRRFAALLTSAWVGVCGVARPRNTAAAPASSSSVSPPASSSASARARELAKALDRGINFGNMLDAPTEGAWGLRVEDAFIALVGDGGFTRSVRLPVRWSNHASADATATVDPVFFERVDGVVDRLLARNVTVVLNMHHYRQLDGDRLDPKEREVAANVVEPRFLAMWNQIARRYASRNDRLIFELYNEPHGRLENRWNDLLASALRIVRESNPRRAVMIGPTSWNSAYHLPKLALPIDPNLILTVHHYEPFSFTHQGAEWVTPSRPVGVDCCDAAALAKINEPLDLAVRESQRLGYPVVVGEFGAYSKAPAVARLRYTRLVRDAMQSRGLPWIYWELAAGFGIYDPVADKFRTDLQQALYGN